MSDDITLQNHGYVYDASIGIWSRPGFSSIAYNDGDEVEDRLARIIAEVADPSVLSMELRKHCTDWPSLYHLSGRRANILRPLNGTLKGARILEIGAGCGAITRYLGEAGANVLALEGSARRATIARSRTRDLNNVVVLADRFADFETLQQFDVITLIGVLEYANLFTPGDAPVATMLNRVRTLLRPEGKLVIAIENQLGLKYLAGAPEDHVGVPLYGVENRYREDQARTFGHKELSRLLEECGFPSVRSFLPFPDYKFPNSIISENGLTKPDFDASVFAWQNVRRDPQFPSYNNFCQELAWPTVFANGMALQLSNSFLLIAEPSPSISATETVLAYHFSTERKPEFCKETVFKVNEDDSISVQCRAIEPRTDAKTPEVIDFTLEPTSDYIHGSLMSWIFIETATRRGWTIADIVEFFKLYRASLIKILQERNCVSGSIPTDGDFNLPGEFLDIIPQNIVVSASGKHSVIDKEWRSKSDVRFSQLVFRSLLAMSGMISYFGRSALDPLPTWKGILEALFLELKLEWAPHTENELVAFEVKVQEDVNGSASRAHFLEWLESKPHNQLTLFDVQDDNKKLTEIITDCGRLIADRDRLITDYQSTSKALQTQLEALVSTSTEQAQRIEQLNEKIQSDARSAEEREHQIASMNAQLDILNAQIVDLRASTSWRMTAPIRFVVHQFKRLYHLMRLAPSIMRRQGSIGSVKKTIAILRSEGLAGLKWRLRMHEGRSQLLPRGAGDRQLNVKLDYNEWIKRYDTRDQRDHLKIANRIRAFSSKPTFSLIMPVFDPPLEFLDEAIRSVRTQLYPNWELCIADDASKNEAVRDLLRKHASEDARIRIVLRHENGHISKASNSALEIAQGDFIAMFDHDDLIPEHALYMFAEEINRNPSLDFLYSDQDKVDASGHRYDPYFKPDFNPDLLRSQNFVDHLAVFRASSAKELGGWRSEFDGSQDYDFVLRFTERLPVEKIAHIPHVLYHWRAVPGSLALDADAKNYAATRSRQALAEHLKRMEITAEVTSEYPNLSIHRVIYPLPVEPLVSIIIPTKDGVDILSQCIEGIFKKTEYQNFEIIIVDNQSEKPETLQYLRMLEQDPRVRVINYDQPFNYSRINNLAAKEAKGSVLALLNNDLEVISGGWLREMVSHAVRPEIGAVGARLFYPDGTVQHAGVLLGYKGRAGHMYRYAPRHWLGYWARAVLIQNLTAVTAACLVLRKDVYDAVGGLDEENFTVTFNDVDLCLRIHEKGYRNLYTPYAELYHHESKTRGLMAFQKEEDYFAERWESYIENDTAYNPNLSLDSEDFSLAFPPRAKRPWDPKGNKALSVKPLVSIITRTYGEREGFLRESIKSVLQQSYRPLQLVVVEDGTSNARAVIDELSLPEGITITYEALAKRGRCFAGNRGMELAKGELFGFLDDDDLLLPDHVASLVEYLHLHPEAVGAYSSSWEVPTEILSLSPLKYVEGTKSLFGRARFSIDALWNYNYMAIQSVLLRKDLFLEYGGFCEELECLEDWDLWLRYTSEHDFVFLDKTTSQFRMPAKESILADRREQHWRYLPTLRDRQKGLLAAYEGAPQYRRLKKAFDSIVAP